MKCPEFPHKEGEYIIQVCPSSYKVWIGHKNLDKLGWEWTYDHIKMILWHYNLNKLEVETQRYFSHHT